MKTERREYKRYENIYIANDGTEFKSEDECKKYEATAVCAINQMFDKIPKQITHSLGDSFGYGFGYDDSLYAIKIDSIEDVEVVNKWLLRSGDANENARSCIGADAVGTIQLFSSYDYDNYIWNIGTPEKMKKDYCDCIDRLFDSLVEKPQEGENHEDDSKTDN